MSTTDTLPSRAGPGHEAGRESSGETPGQRVPAGPGRSRMFSRAMKGGAVLSAGVAAIYVLDVIHTGAVVGFTA